jgi:hypothetical protein
LVLRLGVPFAVGPPTVSKDVRSVGPVHQGGLPWQVKPARLPSCAGSSCNGFSGAKAHSGSAEGPRDRSPGACSWPGCRFSRHGQPGTLHGVITTDPDHLRPRANAAQLRGVPPRPSEQSSSGMPTTPRRDSLSYLISPKLSQKLRLPPDLKRMDSCADAPPGSAPYSASHSLDRSRPVSVALHPRTAVGSSFGADGADQRSLSFHCSPQSCAPVLLLTFDDLSTSARSGDYPCIALTKERCALKKNMGSSDRILRIAAAVLIAVLYFAGVLSGTIAVLLGIIASIFVLTSFFGWCPAYLPFGLSTRR